MHEPSLQDEDLEALRKALGEDAVAVEEPVEVDGVPLGVRVIPSEGRALGEALRVLAERGLPAVVRGGGSRLRLGNPPRGARVLLDTGRMAGVVEIDREEGVACARAGTRLAELRGAAQEGGWELPFDPPGAESSLGGVLAAAAVGPRHLGFGRPRDLVLGLGVTLGDGVRTRCGGRVVKNVTGYDLLKLHVGALGTLGVIESAWIRLRPAPEVVSTLSLEVGEDDQAMARGVEASRLPSARAVVLVHADLAMVVEPGRAPERGYLLVAELAGAEEVVARDVARLTDELGAEPAGLGAVARLRGLHGESFGSEVLRFRVTALPARLADVVTPLERAGGTPLIHPGTGLVIARFALASEGDGAGVDRAWRAAHRAAELGGGACLLESAPAWAKQARDVFGDAPAALGLFRALKQRFDPQGVLNPGRFVGGL